MPTVVCFGDSNTHGADPVTLARFPREVRWPGVLRAELDGAAEVIEEGLNGRTTLWDDPFTDGRNGRPYLLPCLQSHAPVDVLVLMLGTNDLKTIFATAGERDRGGRGGARGPRPGVRDRPRRWPATRAGGGAAPARRDHRAVRGLGVRRGAGGQRQLPRLYRVVAETQGVAFLDASVLVEGDPADGVHLDPAGHGILGRAVADAVREMLGLAAGS